MSQKMKIAAFIAGLTVLCSSGGADQNVKPAEAGARPACLAVSDGGGKVRLFWPAPRTAWPAGGWQILDERGQILIRSVVPGAEAALAALNPDEADFVRSFAKGLPAFKTPADRESFYFALTVKAFTSYTFARAAGLTAALENVPAGPRSFQIAALAADGRRLGAPLRSPAVDASVPTPPPAAPASLRADSRPSGVALFWMRDSAPAAAGAVAFAVERKAAGAEYGPVGKGPVLLAVERKVGDPAAVDREAPLDADLSYRVFGVDAFGRWSVPAETTVYHADHAALAPPGGLKATGIKGKVVLEWNPPASPKVQKIVIERAFYPGGPFSPLGAEGLPGNLGRFEDGKVRGGVTYFYRLHVVGPRDRPGPASSVVAAAAQNLQAPAKPAGLRAALERTRVRLTWNASAGTLLAGYIVERKPKSGLWTRLNEDISPEPRYDDFSGPKTPGTFAYRVRAVALDNQESPPSEAVEVAIPDPTLPPAPEVVSTEGREGRAVVRFKPGLPESRSVQFVVLRSPDPREEGVVLGRPLPAAAREYVDPFVAPGESYWYRVVAIDAAGNRSQLSAAVLVTIGSPPLPPPKAPRAEFVKTPFPHVLVTFDPAPAGLEVVLERREYGQSDWLVLSATARGGGITDATPPSGGTIYYRIFYRAANGADGPSSPAVEIRR